MEEDAVFNTWLHQSFSGEMKFRKLENRNYELDGTNRKPITDYPVYLNVRDGSLAILQKTHISTP